MRAPTWAKHTWFGWRCSDACKLYANCFSRQIHPLSLACRLNASRRATIGARRSTTRAPTKWRRSAASHFAAKTCRRRRVAKTKSINARRSTRPTPTRTRSTRIDVSRGTSRLQHKNWRDARARAQKILFVVSQFPALSEADRRQKSQFAFASNNFCRRVCRVFLLQLGS